MKSVSVVVPIFNEELGLDALYRELRLVTDKLTTYEWKFIFVNDGSRDNSDKLIEKIAKDDRRVVGLILSRNFGKEIALTAGLDAVNSDATIFMDADLQHPPQVIPELLRRWEEGNYVVASVRRSTEKKSVLKHLGSQLFYTFMNRISDVKIVPNTTDFKLLDRRVTDALKAFTERNRMFRGLIDWMGFKTEFVYFEAPKRYAGEVSYSLKQLIRLAINSFTSFSLFPLRVAGYMGVFVFFISCVLLVAMFISRFVFSSGFFSSISFVIVGNTTILGVTLMALGLIALYVGRIHEEVINRPLYVLREAWNVGPTKSQEEHLRIE